MNQKDICDIIIENIRKDWNNSMNVKSYKDRWEILKYSKSQINQAGKTIVSLNSF